MMGVGCAGTSTSPAPPDGAVDAAALDAPPDLGPTAEIKVALDLVAPDLIADLAEAGLPARLVVEPVAHEFQGLAGCKGTPFDFRVNNAGRAPSGPLVVATGVDFQVTADSCEGKTLPAGGACAISVSLKPSTAGIKSSTLSVTAAPGGAAEAKLTATVLAPGSLTLTPNSADFGVIAVGATSPPTRFEMKNTGGSPFDSAAVTLSTTEFIVTNDGCGGHPIAPNSTCQVDVAFHPSTAGANSAILTWSGTEASCGATMTQALLAGTGVASTGGLVITPAEADLGDFCSGKTAVFHVTNTGPTERSALTVQLTGGNFSVAKNGCIAALPPGQSCQVEVVPGNAFGPTGPVMGALTVSATGTQAMATVKGVAPGMADPFLSSPSFPTTLVGQKSAPVEVVVRNAVGAPTAKFTWAFTNVAAAEYSVSDTNCDKPLPGGSSCTLHIVFAPASIGVRNASLVLTAEGCPGGTGAVQLTGVGTAP